MDCELQPHFREMSASGPQVDLVPWCPPRLRSIDRNHWFQRLFPMMCGWRDGRPQPSTIPDRRGLLPGRPAASPGQHCPHVSSPAPGPPRKRPGPARRELWLCYSWNESIVSVSIGRNCPKLLIPVAPGTQKSLRSHACKCNFNDRLAPYCTWYLQALGGVCSGFCR